MTNETQQPESGGPQSKFGKWYANNKESRIEYMREYRDLNRDAVRAYSRKHNAAKRVRDPAAFMLANSRVRAKKAGLPHTITKSDIVVPEFCPILGMRLVVNVGVLGADSPSLDKIVPALGYVPGNVWVISHLANSMKNAATPEQLRAFGAWAITQ